ncbi:zinc-binding dehydrogenase [soil metagenome]
MKAVMKLAPGVGNIDVEEIPEPHPGSGQVLIEVAAAGICGTDLHIYHDEFKTRPPVVLGHELAGTVVALGKGVDGVRVGAKVTTETYFSTCGACRYCRTGHLNLCLQRRSIGSAVNGGFTRYVVVPAQNVHELPPQLSFEAGALTEPLACVVHGVLSTQAVRPGDLAVVAGPGAIGLLTLQVLKAAGAIVLVLGTDADARRLELAKNLGADYTLNIQQDDAETFISEVSFEGLGADGVFECSGAGAAAQGLLKLVRRGGRYVQIGLFGKPVAWDLDQVCYKELVVTGSNASVPASWIGALKLLASSAVTTEALITDSFPITEWREAFERFERKEGVKLLLTPVA